MTHMVHTNQQERIIKLAERIFVQESTKINFEDEIPIRALWCLKSSKIFYDVVIDEFND